MCCCGDTYIYMRPATMGGESSLFWFLVSVSVPRVVHFYFSAYLRLPSCTTRIHHFHNAEMCHHDTVTTTTSWHARNIVGPRNSRLRFLQPTQFIMVFGRRKFTASSNETDTLQQQPIPLSDAQSLDDVGDVEEDTEQAPKPFSRVPVSAPLSPSSSQQPLSVEHYKFGITERLNDAVALKLTDSATLSFRSPDLIPLMKSFDNMRKKLRQMIATVKTYHQSMVTLDHNRLQVCSCFQIRVQVLCLASHDNI